MNIVAVQLSDDFNNDRESIGSIEKFTKGKSYEVIESKPNALRIACDNGRAVWVRRTPATVKHHYYFTTPYRGVDLLESIYFNIEGKQS